MTPPLGTLEFRAEDFSKENLRDERERFFPYGAGEERVIQFRANRLLAERLENAPEVFGYVNTTNGVIGDFCGDDVHPGVTHTARLVCVEKLEGK
jgi:hypothetical protein